MAEQSKFSGALAKLNQRPVESEAKKPEVWEREARELEAVPLRAVELEAPGRGPEPLQEAPLEDTTARRAGGGRPTGKRSDPDFQQTTLLLRKDTKRKAVRQLEDSGAKMDLSELVEQLLAEWTVRSL